MQRYYLTGGEQLVRYEESEILVFYVFTWICGAGRAVSGKPAQFATEAECR